MELCRKLWLPVTLSAYLFEDFIVNQIENNVSKLVNKIKDHIEKNNQDGIGFIKRYQSTATML